MKLFIFPHDVKNLIGKFIVQIDTHKPDAEIGASNWGFYKEKRISFVCKNEEGGVDLQGFFYQHRSFKSDAEFIEYFNNYTGEIKGERFHRLLTNKELDFICSELKLNNFE